LKCKNEVTLPDPQNCSRFLRQKKQKRGSVRNHPRSDSADIKSTQSK